MKKSNYSECFPKLREKEFDEKYALINHAIQLGDTAESKKYKEIFTAFLHLLTYVFVTKIHKNT